MTIQNRIAFLHRTAPIAWLLLGIFLGACPGDSEGEGGVDGEPVDAKVFVAGFHSIAAFNAAGEEVANVKVSEGYGTTLDPDLFAIDGGSAWIVDDGDLVHVNMDEERVVGRVELPDEASMSDLMVSDDAVWMAGGALGVWITKVSKSPLEVSGFELIASGQRFEGMNITAAGVDILVSSGREILRVDPETLAIMKRVQVTDNAKAGGAELAIVNDEYWVALRDNHSETRFARVRIADLEVELSTDPAPWPEYEEAYGFQRVWVNADALFAMDLDTGCIVRTPLDDLGAAEPVYCSLPDDGGYHELQDIALRGNALWVLDDVLGSFALLDATTGEEIVRVIGFAAHGLRTH